MHGNAERFASLTGRQSQIQHTFPTYGTAVLCTRSCRGRQLARDLASKPASRAVYRALIAPLAATP